MPAEHDGSVSRDLATVDAVINAPYEARSHAAGKRPDWDRFRSLFIPSAPLVQTGARTGYYYVWQSVDDYVDEHQHGWKPSHEFSQVELARRTRAFGDVAHVFSVYQQRFVSSERTWSTRGVNSFHLAKGDGAWRITGWSWEEESETHPIPVELLSSTTG